MDRCNHGDGQYHSMPYISFLAKEPVAFQDGRCSMNLFIYY